MEFKTKTRQTEILWIFKIAEFGPFQRGNYSARIPLGFFDYWLSRPVTPQPSDEGAIPPMPALVSVPQADGSVSVSTSTGTKVNVGQIAKDRQVR
ncbi:hypothetical protein BDM02DRAFT_3116661 [Thelephora ganbajun]|uniref:Uncharacterized protein n=1 Tax=Thelephora ganbajun TaxID=370292 RepID=A0ACB6ZE29_THEGA|nr:hypothetical protein BDM02DRAFT_3116661 [Thelephora ganbajun]